ncbi:MAG: rod shape-determining protein, partial [Defluviitaleaceae bacterium]|nr:rod shape-determining protein [Defluviitaleaceae bacterium]
VTGLPNNLTITSEEMREALKEHVTAIVDTVRSVFERTPPELVSDIIERGIVMTGGGSLLYGLDKLIKSVTGINAIIAEDAIGCVAIGTGKFIEFLGTDSAYMYSSRGGRR